jgi:intraflagellar transport protein 81
MRKVADLQGTLAAVEKREGIAGFHQAQENLEKVSELKSEKDEEKGRKLQEISELVQKLVQSINVGHHPLILSLTWGLIPSV